MKRALFVVACLVLVAGFFFGAQHFREQRSATLGSLSKDQASTFVRPHAPRLGAADAKVTVVEFTDPACGTCAAFSPILKKLLEDHPDQVQLVIRYAPFHEGAPDVVRMLEAARMQGKYWETLDLVYASQRAWTLNHVVQTSQLWQVLSQHSDLDMERLSQDVEDPKIRDIIEQDMEDLQTLGVQRTPGIFVNGRPLEPFGVEKLQQLVSEEIAANY